MIDLRGNAPRRSTLRVGQIYARVKRALRAEKAPLTPKIRPQIQAPLYAILVTMRRRSAAISIFVLLWCLLFHYQSVRLNYLSPLLKKELPRIPLLFPPAGWIMFYQITPTYGTAEIYGLKDNEPNLIDPHAIFETNAIGYDNLRRNVMVNILYEGHRSAFCRYLRRKFPDYSSFVVTYVQYLDLINSPETFNRQALYQCG